jgi:hypothetical protein
VDRVDDRSNRQDVFQKTYDSTHNPRIGHHLVDGSFISGLTGIFEGFVEVGLYIIEQEWDARNRNRLFHKNKAWRGEGAGWKEAQYPSPTVPLTSIVST